MATNRNKRVGKPINRTVVITIGFDGIECARAQPIFMHELNVFCRTIFFYTI